MRVSKDEYYLGIALAVAKRSTCLRSAYGAVAVVHDRIISTGYNGSRRGAINCCDEGRCAREHSQTRTDYHLCSAVHAELNLLLNAQSSLIGATMYIAGYCVATGGEKAWQEAFPCVNCYRAMMQAGIKEICIRNGGMSQQPFRNKIEYWDFLEKNGSL